MHLLKKKKKIDTKIVNREKFPTHSKNDLYYLVNFSKEYYWDGAIALQFRYKESYLVQLEWIY